jgi:RNA polymerase sigma factor (sigma-70 family)
MGVQAPVSARPTAAWRPLYSVLGNERLARLVSDGNRQAFAPLYKRYYQQLYRYCRSIVHDDLDAQDALQSTFASAFAALRKGERDAPLRPWLFRIAHNEAVSVIRRRRPAEELSEASEPCGDSVEELAGERARFALLMRDLAELPERQRSALVMRELRALSPTLAATADAALLARSLGAGSGHSGGGAAGLAAGTPGKTAGAALATKAVAGVVIVAAGTAGAAAGLGQITASSHSSAHKAATPPAARASSAPVSVPNGTTVSVGGNPTLQLPGLGSVLGPLGGSGSSSHH